MVHYLKGRNKRFPYEYMFEHAATAIAHPNIALIKYWGDLDQEHHIPANGSISMNLTGMSTHTRVRFEQGLADDQITLNDKPADVPSSDRVSRVLEQVRIMAGMDMCARVESHNDFPTGVGIASSASGFAALALAATCAAGLGLEEKALSRLARLGSGSACRSIPGGFVEWKAGRSDEESYAFSVAPPDYWDLVDCVALVNLEEKPVSSREGHEIAHTSPLQSARITDAPRRLDICREAILKRDFDALANIVELDSNLMHAVMFTSDPPLFYWQAETLIIMREVRAWRKSGLPVCYTVDAGPNVHVLCAGDVSENVVMRLKGLPGILNIIESHPGGPAGMERA